MTDEVRRTAQRRGWEGPWERVTWAQLIEEVIKHQSISLVDVPEVPKEEGIRATNLQYFTTSLDTYECQGARPKQKMAEYVVTSEAWERREVLQIPGTIAQREAMPINPDSTQRIKLQMVVVPYKEVYSVGPTVNVLKDTLGEAVSQHPDQPRRRRLGLNILKNISLPTGWR